VPQQLVVVGGIIASGKSTVAEALAARLGARLLVADDLRDEIAETGRPEARLPGFWKELYPRLLERAERCLAQGDSVVLDGTFRSRRLRAAARELARRQGAAFRFVECRAEPEVCRARLSLRGGEDEVAGWRELFDHFVAELWEPVDELSPDEHRVLDTTGCLEDGLAGLEAWLV
jgi:predicted kinase